MGKYSKLLKNSSLFAIANLSSNFISFIFVRFYTELLSTSQYGTIDYVVTISSMLIPFITLAIVEAVLRFGIDEKNKSAVLTNGLLVALIGNLATIIIGPFILAYTDFRAYTLLMLGYILSSSINAIAAQFVRSIGRVSDFAFGGILKTFSLVICNLILLLGLNLKIEGYLLSLIISETLTFAFYVLRIQMWKYISLNIDYRLLKKMVVYSLPLIPSSLAWWLMNMFDKQMIVLFLGISANGLYAVAHKIPTLINLCNSLFFQAWQLSAVEELDKEDSVNFYSNVFNMLAMFLFIIKSGLLLFIKPIMLILVSEDFRSAYIVAPFLILSMVFSAFSSFLGTNYTVSKKTSGALKTTALGAVIDIVFNYFFIQLWGLNGAALATMLSFLAMWIARAIDTGRFISINYDFKRIIPTIIILLIQSCAIILNLETVIYIQIICLLSIFAIYKKRINELIKKIIISVRGRT